MTITQTSESQIRVDTQWPSALGSPFSRHPASEAFDVAAGESLSGGHARAAAHSTHAAGTLLPDATSESVSTAPSHQENSSGLAANPEPKPISGPRRGPILYSGYLCLLSDTLDDIEALRIATENRVRSLTRTEADGDGQVRGLGLDARSPEVMTAIVMLDTLKGLEKDATKAVQKAVRKHPLFGWVRRSKGIGEKQAGRLLAVIGDPYWNDLHDRPRTVSELWAYAGYSVISGSAQRRRKGVQANWNDKAKMRAYLMAESCMKSPGGHYRDIYDDARKQYEDAMHPHDCARCGPAGKPALAGTPLSAGHQHARALRRVAKEILKDLWLEARSIHTEGI